MKMVSGLATAGMGISPAVALVDPKYGHNAATALRACSAFGAKQLWLTGDRWADGWDKRMPREERMKAYGDVDVYRCDSPLRAFEGTGITPVAVEVHASAEPLTTFIHPDNAVYVFGPEDGSLPDWAFRNCHRFVQIPSDHCLNLGAAINVVLCHRRMSRQLAGLEPILPSSATLREQRGFIDDDEPLRWTA